jgi:ion channel-forming bestrophin family protein
MLTVMGFLVGIALSLRNSTAYERYSEGRRYWSTLSLHTTNLARLIWINGKERDGELGKEDLLGKMYVNKSLICNTSKITYSYIELRSTCLLRFQKHSCIN